MTQPIPDGQMRAIRALREGQVATFPLLAEASAIHETTLRKRSIREKWLKLPLAETRARIELMRAVQASLAGKDAEQKESEALAAAIETVGKEGCRAFIERSLREQLARASLNGGMLDKKQIDALSALSRVAERHEGREVGTAQSEQEDDDQLVESLKRIDERIVELAEFHAARMGCSKCRKA